MVGSTRAPAVGVLMVMALAIPAFAYADCVALWKTARDAERTSTLVFSGTVIKSSPDVLQTSFHVDRVWKGDVRQQTTLTLYPGLESHPDHEIAQQCLDGFGGMMAVVLAGGGDGASRFLQKLELVTHAPSLGGVDTLVSEPRYTSHAAMTPEGRAEIGIPDGFLRFSIGLEDFGDLIADFEQALR